MKRVLITGVSRGIGKATAEKFLQEGWFVIGTSTIGNTSIENPNLQMLALDMNDPLTIADVAKKVGESKEKIDVLINNAGIALPDDAFPVPRETLLQTLTVNVIGPIDLTQQLLGSLNDNGYILNVSSNLSSLEEGMGDYEPAYSISKAALNMFTKRLAATVQKRGIIVAAVDPGWVRTDMGGPSAPRDPKESAEEIFALTQDKIESGCFWYKGKIRSW